MFAEGGGSVHCPVPRTDFSWNINISIPFQYLTEQPSRRLQASLSETFPYFRRLTATTRARLDGRDDIATISQSNQLSCP